MKKVVIIGDIGGQLEVFQDTLKRVGIGKSLIVPSGTIIVQIGDIVRMNNSSNLDSVGCLELANQLILNNPDSWIQLLGNHEAPFIGSETPKAWEGQQTLETCRELISKWYRNNMAHFAVSVENGESNILSHAGLTYGFLSKLGVENSLPKEIVKAVNQIARDKTYHQYAETGVINFFGESNTSADFLWAAAGDELIPSWSGVEMHFNQIHGHDTPLISWQDAVLRSPMPEGFFYDFDVSTRLSMTSTSYGKTFKTVDWVLKESVSPDTSNLGIIEMYGDVSL